jgi:pilus assembly protein CpaB
MQTAGIVVLALGAGGVAAYLARGTALELKPEQAETLVRARQSGTLALRSIADINMVENSSEESALKRGESVKVDRCGVQRATTTQK